MDDSRKIINAAKTNFTIIADKEAFRIVPVSKMGESLKAHCRYHGANFLHPTYAGAKAAVDHMDQAIENRNGKPWQVFKAKTEVVS